jgi:dTDP-4-dehydrorhamnose 3,5-epimerase
MKIVPTSLADVFQIQPSVYGDTRGYFLETWNKNAYEAIGIKKAFVQDNHSFSVKGTLRGLHFQNPTPQGKLVWVIEGAVWDVVLDLRKSSQTYGRWQGFELSSENKVQIWVPRGFAHGFYVTANHAHFVYKCDEYYKPSDQHTIAWNDPDLAIAWPLVDGVPPRLSENDSRGRAFSDSCDVHFC